MDKSFIFDLDDTLMSNLHDYSGPQLAFVRWVIDAVGPRAPDPQTILNLHVTIDKELVKIYRFNRKRFPTSFQETYKQICKPLGRIPTDAELKEAYEIGDRTFDQARWKKNGLFDGAAETLEFLVEQHDELILLTKGDEEVQRMKIEATGVKKWFGSNIYIVPDKSAKVVTDVVGTRDKSKVWHVGNSVKSDVIHGLDAGIKVIYIPFETWEWEKDHPGVPTNPRLKTYHHISDIKTHYALLDVA